MRRTACERTAPSSKVSSEVDAFTNLDAFAPLDQPMSLTVDGTLITGTTTFSFVSVAGTPQESVISGTLTPLSYTASLAAVPEPAEWLLLASAWQRCPCSGVSPSNPSVSSRQQLPQHKGQDAAVAVVVDLDRRVDAQGERRRLH